MIVGLTRYANKGHLARATLEATAYQTREVLEAMELDMNSRIDVLRTDGGMVVDDLLMQFQADILGRDVIRPLVNATTALGAAYAAALAVGFYTDLAELKDHWRIDRTGIPILCLMMLNRNTIATRIRTKLWPWLIGHLPRA